VTTSNGLITGCAMNGLSSQARLLLRNRQPKAAGLTPNAVSWTSLFSGSCHSGEFEDALTLFAEMQSDGVLQPSLVTTLVLRRAHPPEEMPGAVLFRATQIYYAGETVVGTAQWSTSTPRQGA
jgi:pentatricopeptide repeat protein